MSGLKQLKSRMNTVQATMKITSAMKMISVSKLRQSHEALMKAYPFADEINRMVRRLVRSATARQEELISIGSPQVVPLPMLLKGRPEEKRHLVVLITSDEGLCGQFNLSLINKFEQVLDVLEKEEKKISVLCFGYRGGEILKKKYPTLNIHIAAKRVDKNMPLFLEAERLSTTLMDSFYRGAFDICTVIYSEFETAANQKIKVEQLVPLQTFFHENKWQKLIDSADPFYVKRDVLGQKHLRMQETRLFGAIGGRNIKSPLGAIDSDNLLKMSTRQPEAYDYDGGDIKILERILPYYMEYYIYKILLDTTASESASRMIAMENASKSAGDMMTQLSKKYHRKRQELVTKDLTEVVAGAES